MRTSISSLILVASFVAGCGGTVIGSQNDGGADTSTTTDGGTDSGGTVDGGSSDFCGKLSERATKCGTSAPTGCEAQLACYRAIVRAEDLDPLLGCFATRDCSTSEDKCVADASAKYATDGTVSNYVKLCTDHRTACMGVFSDDYCGRDFGLFVDSAREKLQSCFLGPCDTMKSCLDGVYASFGCR
jgi:hypothetical protein